MCVFSTWVRCYVFWGKRDATASCIPTSHEEYTSKTTDMVLIADQIRMYREFVLMVFPAIYMSVHAFSQFMIDLGWQRSQCQSLFRYLFHHTTKQRFLPYSFRAFNVSRQCHIGTPTERRRVGLKNSLYQMKKHSVPLTRHHHMTMGYDNFSFWFPTSKIQCFQSWM